MSAAVGANKYALMARKSAQRGSKRFVYVQAHDDRQAWPSNRGRGQTDNPFKNYRGWTRFRWCVHDVRIYGLWDAGKKFYYLLDSWRQRGERVYCGSDELGNQYYMSHDSCGQSNKHGRMVIPADPHVLRGQDGHCCPPEWQAWLHGNLAHTPAQIKARGEYGPHGRISKSNTMWNVRWRSDNFNQGLANDPTYTPTTSVLVSPWYKLMEESGFSVYNYNMNPTHAPFLQPHDVKQEVVEDFYRQQHAFCRQSKGQDHDEWR
jgi:NADH:ubiquinone oxidoreductase subunit